MMFVQDVDYDPVSRVLTVRMVSPSRVHRSAWQYRDVSPELAREVEAARPHLSRAVETKVRPVHAVRRVGDAAWRNPPV